jgi:hypothetical protein
LLSCPGAAWVFPVNFHLFRGIASRSAWIILQNSGRLAAICAFLDAFPTRPQSLLFICTRISSSSSSTDSVNAALSNWMTYQADGTASTPAITDPTADGLNTVA